MDNLMTLDEKVQLENELSALQAELDEVHTRIRLARELGDLSENEEYTTALAEQSDIANRIADKRALLESSVVISGSSDAYSNLFRNGSYVVVSNEVEDGTSSRVLQLGKLNCTVTAGVLHVASPLGRAIMNQTDGTYRVECREGNYINYTVRHATPEEILQHNKQFPDKNTVLDRIFDL